MSRRQRLRRVVPGALHRLEPLAPQWLVALAKPRPAAPPWAAMVRYAITLGSALAAGVVAGQTGLGALVATGALTGAFGDRGGPIPERLRRIAAGLVGGLAGLVLSRLLLETTGVVAVLIVMVAGVVSAYLSAVGAITSFGALQLLVMTAVGSGLGAQVGLPVLLGAFAVGGLWSTLLSVVFALVRPEAGGPRQAVSAAFGRLADYLDAVVARKDLAAPRAALAAALSDAWDALTAARATSPGRRDDLHRLSATLGPAADLARAAVADRSAAAGLPEAARAVQRVVARERGARLPPPTEVAPAGSATAAAYAQIERAIGSRVRPTGARPVRRRGAGMVERLLGRGTAVFAVRLALCLGVAETLRAVLPLTHPYWLLLTVAVVLKPDLGSVFARGVQRTAGTLVGVVVGVGVLLVVPAGPLLLIPVVLLAFGFPYAAARNYGMLSTFITPLVLILVDLAGGVTSGLAAGRLLDTLLGAAIVLLVGYLPWPSTWRPRLGDAVIAALEALTAYAAVAVDHDRTPAGPARRRAFAALQNLRGDLQAALAEPPPRSRYAAAWWPVLGSLEQIGDDLRSADLISAPRERRAADSAQVVTALRAVEAGVRGRRRPEDTPLPQDGPLVGVAQDVRELRHLLAGPAGLPRGARRRPGRAAPA